MKIKSGYKSINGDYVFSQTQQKRDKFIKEHQNIKLIDLSIGDVKLPPPYPIYDALKKSVDMLTDSNFCGYPPESGLLFLREVISKEYQKDAVEACSEKSVSTDEIFITEGAKPALGAIMELAEFTSPLIVAPTYPLYEELCLANGLNPRFLKGRDYESFPHLQGYADVIFLCSPCNPTGSVISKAELQNYVDFALENKALIVLDAAYAAFNLSPYNVYSLKGANKCLIEVNSYSKSLSFTGLRCGYMVIKKENALYNSIQKWFSLRSNGVNRLVQYAAAQAYSEEGKSAINKVIDGYRVNAQILRTPFDREKIKCIGGINAPYLLCKTDESGYKVADELLSKVAVAVTPGEAFRAEGWVRLSCLTDKETAIDGSRRIDSCLNDVWQVHNKI